MKTILITGATDGIGLATATELARQGHEVVVHGRNEDKALHACDAIRAAVPNAKLQTAYADFADLSAVARMGHDLVARLPRLDVLVNNAGVYKTEWETSQRLRDDAGSEPPCSLPALQSVAAAIEEIRRAARGYREFDGACERTHRAR